MKYFIILLVILCGCATQEPTLADFMEGGKYDFQTEAGAAALAGLPRTAPQKKSITTYQSDNLGNIQYNKGRLITK